MTTKPASMTTAAATSQAGDLPMAAAPHIVLASHRDVFYSQWLGSETKSVLAGIFGPWLLAKYGKEIQLGVDLCYYGLTTLAGAQTLGEEFCGIVQADVNAMDAPGFVRRSTLVFAQVLGPFLLDKLLLKAERYLPSLEAPNDETSVYDRAKYRALQLLVMLRPVVPNLHRLHSALFYLFGSYYHMAKRVTGVQYVNIGGNDPGLLSSGYKLLGALALCELAVKLVLYLRSILKRRKLRRMQNLRQPTTVEPITSTAKCTLCLGPRIDTTATQCGHLYCWSCILDWCATNPVCPLCRQNSPPQRLCRVYNM